MVHQAVQEWSKRSMSHARGRTAAACEQEAALALENSARYACGSAHLCPEGERYWPWHRRSLKSSWTPWASQLNSRQSSSATPAPRDLFTPPWPRPPPNYVAGQRNCGKRLPSSRTAGNEPVIRWRAWKNGERSSTARSRPWPNRSNTPKRVSARWMGFWPRPGDWRDWASAKRSWSACLSRPQARGGAPDLCTQVLEVLRSLMSSPGTWE